MALSYAGHALEASQASWVYPHTLAHAVSGGTWKPYPYLQLISRTIASMVVAGGGQLIVNVPPRHGKSEFISRYVPQWFLNTWPERHVILGSYAAPLAKHYGRLARNDMLAHQDYFRTRLVKDKRREDHWATDKGGGMLCVGVDGAVTGFGGHLLLLDDPHKNWEEAWSPGRRQKTVDWYQGTFSTRTEPGAVTVVLMTRWHTADLTGNLITGDDAANWRVIRLPALAEKNDPVGRAEGEALVPERYSAEWLRRKRIAVTDAVWYPVYQQDPRSALGGRLFQQFTDDNIRAFEIRDALPLCITFDFNINPGMHVELAQVDTQADVFYFHDEVHEARLSVRDAVDLACKRWVEPMLERWRARKAKADRAGTWIPDPEVHIYGDPSGAQESITRAESGYDLIRARLRQYPGLQVAERVARKQPAPIDRVEALRDALCDLNGVRRVFVNPRCVRLLTDLREVLPDLEGGPDKSNPLLTHASEAAMFLVWFVRPIGGALTSGLRGGVYSTTGQGIMGGSGLPGVVDV